MTAATTYKLTAPEWELFIEQLKIRLRDQCLEISNLLHARDSLRAAAALGDTDAAGRLEKTDSELARKKLAVQIARTAILEARSHLEKT